MSAPLAQAGFFWLVKHRNIDRPVVFAQGATDATKSSLASTPPTVLLGGRVFVAPC